MSGKDILRPVGDDEEVEKSTNDEEEKEENEEDEKLLAIVTSGTASFIGSVINYWDGGITLSEVLVFGEAIQRDQQTGQVVNVNVMFQKPQITLDVPKELIINNPIIRFLDFENSKDKTMILAYEKNLQTQYAGDAGILAPPPGMKV